MKGVDRAGRFRQSKGDRPCLRTRRVSVYLAVSGTTTRSLGPSGQVLVITGFALTGGLKGTHGTHACFLLQEGLCECFYTS